MNKSIEEGNWRNEVFVCENEVVDRNEIWKILPLVPLKLREIDM